MWRVAISSDERRARAMRRALRQVCGHGAVLVTVVRLVRVSVFGVGFKVGLVGLRGARDCTEGVSRTPSLLEPQDQALS